jgi:hypothetical protein
VEGRQTPVGNVYRTAILEIRKYGGFHLRAEAGQSETLKQQRGASHFQANPTQTNGRIRPGFAAARRSGSSSVPDER